MCLILFTLLCLFYHCPSRDQSQPNLEFGLRGIPVELLNLADVFLESLDAPLGQHLADDHLRQRARVQHRNLKRRSPIDTTLALRDNL